MAAVLWSTDVWHMFTAPPSRFIASRLSPTAYPIQHKTAMSVSIEDLVASLSSNHIGQEALDLAALQVGLPLSCTTGLSYPTLSHSSLSLSSHTSSRLRTPISPSAVVTRATFSTAPHPLHAHPPRPSSGPPTIHTRADRAPPLPGCGITYRMIQCTWQTWTTWTTRMHSPSRP